MRFGIARGAPESVDDMKKPSVPKERKIPHVIVSLSETAGQRACDFSRFNIAECGALLQVLTQLLFHEVNQADQTGDGKCRVKRRFCRHESAKQ